MFLKNILIIFLTWTNAITVAVTEYYHHTSWCVGLVLVWIVNRTRNLIGITPILLCMTHTMPTYGRNRAGRAARSGG